MQNPLVDMAEWPGLELLDPLTGGHRNPVFLARYRGRSVVVRQSGRPIPTLEWELDLLEHLDSNGVRVPRIVPAADGRRFVGPVLVQEFLPGGPPRTEADWRNVLAVLRDVHALGVGWTQRPGFASARSLLIESVGGDVDLGAMPSDAAALVQAAWLPVLDGALETVVHGDPGGGNVLVAEDGSVGLIDWDEARVDVPAFDLAGPYLELTDLGVRDEAWRDAMVAGLAWEAATCWRAEPVYARRRLAELRTALKSQ
ncbi:phosphotransferase enzyme family protein [Tenggerimyces flavus]|uniref:Phosphotransferase enzyme family protein n=1 Tax=Tenggerimyces flavus TaxID=1708749 RepID=A0ABV7Y732_9ACTN|nr:phosphotransferase [Tenggerimyces flavus]MBM7785054.1 Ser/Thr protein kinase RdoA (MazF antagonist) [Tenggerimyces flavus]